MRKGKEGKEAGSGSGRCPVSGNSEEEMTSSEMSELDQERWAPPERARPLARQLLSTKYSKGMDGQGLCVSSWSHVSLTVGGGLGSASQCPRQVFVSRGARWEN